jgi:hypothetical protein
LSAPRRLASALGAAAVLGVVSAVAWPACGHAAPIAGSARVTFLAGASVYVEAGRLDGLREGDTLTVIRDGGVIARLLARDLSSHRASCDTFAVVSAPAVGDLVRFVPHTADAGSAGSPLASSGTEPALIDTAAAPPPDASRSRLRGRVGVHAIAVQSSAGSGFAQPAVDLRLDQRDAGGAWDFALDVRARRTVATGGAASAPDRSTTRVYRMAAVLHDRDSRWRLSAGRQSSAGIASVSLFDGVLAEHNARRFSVRLFSGMQPEPLGMRLSNDILEHGAAVEWRSAPGLEPRRRWSLAAGAVSSYHGAEPNRDFGFVQGFFSAPRVTMFVTQEADLARGWKRELGEPALALTSTFASARVVLHEGVTASAGYDNRRSVRLWRDRLTPENLFDDEFRQGAWAGVSVTPWKWLRVTTDGRLQGAAGDHATSWTGGAELVRVTPLLLTLRARMTRVDGDPTDAGLLSLALALDPAAGVHLELLGGSRFTRYTALGVEDRSRWEGVDADIAVGGHWYLSASYEHEHGDLADLHQEYAGISRRF